MEQKSIFIAIAGKPNVGKSTLLNCLIQAKIAIATPKPQTTRNRIMGVYTEDETQFVFIDTPGFHVPKTKLGETMIKGVRESVSDVDVVLFVVEPRMPSHNDRLLLEELSKNKIPVMLVINKVDTLENQERVQKVVEMLKQEYSLDKAFAVSAIEKTGTKELMDVLKQNAVQGPHLYESDALTDIPEKVIAAEIIREKLLLFLSDELPHGCAVVIETFKEREDKPILDISATIISEKNSHKAMIIGKGGNMLKKISSSARYELEKFFDIKINLKCFVKVREGWRNNDLFLKEYGFN